MYLTREVSAIARNITNAITADIVEIIFSADVMVSRFRINAAPACIAAKANPHNQSGFLYLSRCTKCGLSLLSGPVMKQMPMMNVDAIAKELLKVPGSNGLARTTTK